MIIHLTVIGIVCQYIENIIDECESVNKFNSIYGER